MPQSDSKPAENGATENVPIGPTGSSQIAEFEKSLDELEKLVARMEQGDQSLDDSLKSFERGIALYRNCQSALEQAELRVKLLSDPQSPDDAEDFEDLP
jgi:exodeoxyribonuclease VII small subunit